MSVIWIEPLKLQAVGGTYPTLDPSNKQAAITLSNGNLTATYAGGAYTAGVLATISKSSGQWYFEGKADAVGQNYIGVTNTAAVNGSADNRIYSDASTFAYLQSGNKHTAGAGSAFGTSFTTNDIIGVAWDAGAGKIWFSKNGTWQASGDPAAGTSPAFSGLSGSYFPFVIAYSAGQFTMNFGASAFNTAPPSGFLAIT